MTTHFFSTGDLLLIVRHLVTDSTFCFEIQVGGLEAVRELREQYHTISNYQLSVTFQDSKIEIP